MMADEHLSKSHHSYARAVLIGLQSRRARFIHNFFVITHNRAPLHQHWLQGAAVTNHAAVREALA